MPDHRFQSSKKTWFMDDDDDLWMSSKCQCITLYDNLSDETQIGYPRDWQFTDSY